MKDNAEISDNNYFSGTKTQNLEIKKAKKCAGQYSCVVYDSQCKERVTSTSINVPSGKHLM